MQADLLRHYKISTFTLILPSILSKSVTTYGTDRFPRLQPDVLDSRPIPLPPVPGVPTANSYFYKGPNELVNGYNPPFEGSFDPILSLINGDTLKLIDDQTISAFKYYNYHYSGQTTLAGLAIFKKMEHPPIDTSGLDWNDPVNLFKYYASANTFANLSTSQHTGALNYVGKESSTGNNKPIFEWNI